MESYSDKFVLRKSMSGLSLNPCWTLGDFLRDESRHGQVDVTESGSSSHEVHVRNEKNTGPMNLTTKGVANRQSLEPRMDLESVFRKNCSSTAASRSILGLVVLTRCTTIVRRRSRADHSDDPPPPERLGHLQIICNVPLSRRWREVQGAKNWTGLLDPIDLDLRREILRYGDFATLTYDNFESDSWSKYAGRARFRKHQMLEKLHKQDTCYKVTRYLYATCENPLPGALRFPEIRKDVESNWIGYVAVATDVEEIERLGRRDIVVAWRGTVRTMEWLVDAEIQMVPIMIAGGAAHSKATKICPKVENGFWSLYTSKRSPSHKSASQQVITELARLLTLYKGETLSITLTGHSLGGALAILTAYEIAARGLNYDRQDINGEDQIQHMSTMIPVTVFSFGSPHVGNAVFRRRFEEMNLKALRVVEAHDLVPKTMNSAMICLPWVVSEPYKHVGVELQVDHTLSPYLKRTRDPVDCHNVECYLHLVDGHQGLTIKPRFALVTGRDYALVNKYSDMLLERYCVPPSWWQVENKGLELSAEGRWVEPGRAWEDHASSASQSRQIFLTRRSKGQSYGESQLE